MNVKQSIFLVGLAGSGKSTLGRDLADLLQLQFIDLDQAIEDRVGRTIPEIFAHQGEGNFRILEKETLRELMAEQDSFVMATGGGAPCYHFNMDAMNEHGLTVYLDVNPEDLALRILDGGIESRPMFKSYNHQDLILEIREMKERRAPYYEMAKIKIRDNQITSDLIVSYLNSSGYFKS